MKMENESKMKENNIANEQTLNLQKKEYRLEIQEQFILITTLLGVGATCSCLTTKQDSTKSSTLIL